MDRLHGKKGRRIATIRRPRGVLPVDTIPTDEHLIRETLEDDPEVFAILVKRHKGKVFRIASRFARDNHELEDLCQEIFIKAYQGLRTYRNESPFEHWLSRIAVHTCYDLLRKKRREGDYMPLEYAEFSLSDPSGEAGIDAGQARQILNRAFVKLKPKERLVITLLALEEKSVREVAELTGWSEGNVRIRAFRARQRLKNILEVDNER
jgi:RNA polymerase sigma-70 factor (ECF subfamily)